MDLSVLPKLICGFDVIRVKPLKDIFLGENGQTGFKCYKEMQRDANSQSILKNKD